LLDSERGRAVKFLENLTNVFAGRKSQKLDTKLNEEAIN
jgi:hypothetical protein